MTQTPAVSPPAHAAHRPALDGLRAVAVLGVLAYHTSIVDLPGGFLGVDVFFVLSGYLITGLLLAEHARNRRIDLPAFWVRRARRLLPAALVMLVVCAFVTSQVATTVTLPTRRADLLGTLFYYANWHFIGSDQSYFADFTGVSPLRHTWSLAIEEQFYLLWPLVLMGLLAATRRLRGALPWVLGAMAIGSAVLMATKFVASDPARAYYGTDTRVHELLVGALLAVVLHRRPAALTSARARVLAQRATLPVLAVLTVAFIALGDRSSLYYRGGSLAFAVVVAAAIWIVEARPTGVAGSAVSTSPMTWIGKISYGLYLWHWPLLVWIDSSERFQRWDAAPRHLLVLAMTFVVATASYYLVEQPIRHGMVPWVRMHGRRLAAAALVCIVVSAGAVVQMTQIGSSAVVRQVTDVSDRPCPPGSPVVGPFTWCARTQAKQPRSAVVAVAGDSTSRALDPGMEALAARRGWAYIQAGQNGCSSTGLLLAGSADAADVDPHRMCPTAVPALLDDVNTKADPDVWIVMDWTTLGTIVQPDGSGIALDDPGRADVLVPAIQEELRRLTAGGAQVIYVATPPNGEPVDCTTDRPVDSCGSTFFSVAYEPVKLLNEIERTAVEGVPGVVYVSITDVLCPGTGQCPAVIGGVLARYDGVHYTSTFSKRAARLIMIRAREAGITFAHDSEVAAGNR